MNLKTLIFPAMNCLIWGCIAWLGFNGEKGVEARMGGVSLAQVYPPILDRLGPFLPRLALWRSARPGRSPKLAAFVARNDPLDHFVRRA